MYTMTTTPQAALLSINYFDVQQAAETYGLDYNKLGCAVRDILAKLQATQAETVQAGELPDERGAFEAEMRCSEEWGHRSLKKRTNGKYENWQVDLMWDVWQARAALSARKPLTDEQIEPMFKARNSIQTEGTKDAWYWCAWGVNDGEQAHGIGGNHADQA